jgi:CubicO group peptidase (beta-lactamase class C family)
VGSLTKMFTSTAILQLAGRSRLSLTDPVSKYIPGFPYSDSVQIVHLLSHTSGISGTTEPPEPKDLEESVSHFRYQKASFAPGTQFEYNNFNYILLSYIIQKVSHMPYQKFIQSQVIAKAGMTHSGIDSRNRISTQKATGYVTNPQTGEWQEANEGNVDIASGAGALYSTARDLYKWSLAVTKYTVLEKKMLDEAFKPIRNNYGMGWMTTETFGRKQLGHTGSIPGFIANFMMFPGDGTTIIILSNYQDVDGRQISQDVAAAAFNESYSLPVVKKEAKVSDDELRKYVGQYQLPNGFSITVSTENNKLFALAQGDQEAVELTPEGNNKFFLKGPETAIEFINENGEVKYMFVNIQGGQKLSKVK